MPGGGLNSYEFEEEHTQDVLRRILGRLLLQLKPTDANLLNKEQRDYLNRQLNERTTKQAPEFVIAILKAWEQVGDRNAMPAVQALAQRNARTENQRQVQKAAQACLTYLQDRPEYEEQTLLLPTQAPPSGDSLLRPAEDMEETDPMQLLRPGEPRADQ